jgi:anti-sigma regulatory factor (Ser/Thr protein kinase)
MFVTCQYMILDPATGHMQYANAGHNLPYYRDARGVTELRATGMPLGLMPEMTYEEKETFLAPGGCVLFYSDGLVEAHNSAREMFSFQRLRDLMATHDGGTVLIDFLLEKLKEFTGPDWEQEDDVTFMMLYRDEDSNQGEQSPAEEIRGGYKDPVWRTLAKFELPSDQGNERQAMAQVADAVRDLEIPVTRLERLKTAVAEATMNAIEHGNKFRSEIPVSVVVYASDRSVKITITDQGGGMPIPEAKNPDLDAKLAGLQSPRGWGLFLIKNMVDDMKVISDDTHHTVELVFNLEGVAHDGQAVGS